MQISQMNWMQVEDYLKSDDRCVVPIGSTEQHAQLSLCVDKILAERVALEAAEPLGIPVFPVMPYGIAPYFLGYSGTISLRVETLLAVVRDIIASLARGGFRRLLIVNGHGGNSPVGALAQELMGEYPAIAIKFHNWWSAPKTFAKAMEIDPDGSHANWMENFPWTRLDTASAPPGRKPSIDTGELRGRNPESVRALIGDGSFGGEWQKDDDTMRALWAVGVAETREALEGPWPNLS